MGKTHNRRPCKDEKPTIKELQCMTYTEDKKEIYFRLMERLKPRWKKVAIALNFSIHHIDTLKQEDDSVCQLLSEWLGGANQGSEDPTWASLIEALKHANCQEEAKILEEKLIIGSPASQPMPQTSRALHSRQINLGCSTNDEIEEEEEEEGEEEEEEEEESIFSTSSSGNSTPDMDEDYSPQQMRKKRQRNKSDSSSDEESEENEEESDEEEIRTPRSKRSSLENSEADHTDYWPPDWLKLTKPCQSPYFPQVGDIVVYCYQGHQLYCKEVKENKLNIPVVETKALMPWKKFTLRPHEVCQVKKVNFVVGPPTLCSITLEPSSSQCASQERLFEFKFHDMDGVLEFILLEKVVTSSLKHRWSPGDKVQCFIGDKYWPGTVLKLEPFSKDVPDSVWQAYHVEWEDESDGGTQRLSHWEMHPIEDDENNEEQIQSEWEGTQERERILEGLKAISKPGVMEEAHMFIDPVDLEKVSDYCDAVAYPISLSIITERLENRFYRRKLALVWDVTLLTRNALAYNEEDSLIVKHSRIVANTVLKFISNCECTDIMECYSPELTEADISELATEVIAPEVEWKEPEITFPQLFSPEMHLSGKEDEKNEEEEEEDKEALAARERRSSLRSYNGERQSYQEATNSQNSSSSLDSTSTEYNDRMESEDPTYVEGQEEMEEGEGSETEEEGSETDEEEGSEMEVEEEKENEVKRTSTHRRRRRKSKQLEEAKSNKLSSQISSLSHKNRQLNNGQSSQKSQLEESVLDAVKQTSSIVTSVLNQTQPSTSGTANQQSGGVQITINHNYYFKH